MTRTSADELKQLTDFSPEDLEEPFDLKDLITQLETAATDGNNFFQTMLQAEKWRLCEWDHKDPKRSGRRVSLPGKPAKPYEGAPDHEVYLIQEHLNYRRLLRRAALAGGRITVGPHEVNDDRKAGLMQSVMRWFNAGPEGRAVHTSILRAANYADRFAHSLLYVGWHRQLGLQPLTLTRQQVLDLVMMKMEEEVASMMPPVPEGEPVPQMIDTAQAEQFLVDKGNEPQLAAYIYAAYPGLQKRDKAGRREAVKAAKAILKGDDEVTVYQCYQRANRPEVLALRYGIDYLLPSNTLNDPRLQDVPWIALWRPYSAAQLKARASAEDWDEKWVAKVLQDHKGQPNFIVNHAQAHSWSTHPRWMDSQEAIDHTYFILEVWQQATTDDGCLAIHHTVLHPDCSTMVGKREVTPDWHGQYPFVAISIDPDEALLLEPRSLPELLHTTQDAVKAQVDSRSAAAALTTLPPRTGGPGTEHLPVVPNGFIPTMPGKEVKFLDMPTPDGRSIEIERSLAAYAARLLGQPSESVPEIISRLAAEDTSNTFLATVDHVYFLISQLLGQYMSPLQQARITGTKDTVTATAEDIRGSYDIAVKFDSRTLSPEYQEQMLNFFTKAIPVLDRRGDVNTLPTLRTMMNGIDPSLADASLPKDDSAITQQQRDQAIAALNDILNGGSPPIYKGQDPAAQAQIITEEIQRSPLRQEIIQSHQQIQLVLGSYLKTLSANAVQENENPTTGLTLGKDPLRQPTAAEQMSEMLLSEPTMEQGQPPPQEGMPV